MKHVPPRGTKGNSKVEESKKPQATENRTIFVMKGSLVSRIDPTVSTHLFLAIQGLSVYPTL